MANRFWVGGTGTWNGSSTANWASTSGGASGQSVPGSADTVTFDASSGGGVVTVNTNFTITSLTMGAFTGTLDFSANNNSPTMGTFSGTGTGTRTLNMGSGTWTLTGTGTPWNLATISNFNFNAEQSRILFTNSSTGNLIFAGGGLTYYTVEFARGASTATITINFNNTFTNFIDNTSTAAHTITFATGSTQNFYKFNVRGSAGALVTMNRPAAPTPTLTKLGKGIVCYCDYITLGALIGTPANTWYIGANSSIGTSTGFIATAAPSSQSLLGTGGVG
jgi:hypothetical protein